MQLFIEPVDVWLFRDGRSFNASEDHWAQSLFPPFPSVMQGVIRSHHLIVTEIGLSNPVAIKVAVGTDTDFKKLQLSGPLIMKQNIKEGVLENIRYYPSPADAITIEDKNKYTIQSLKPGKSKEDIKTSTSTPCLLLLPEGTNPQKGDTNLWLAEDELIKYLSGNGNIAVGTPSCDLFQLERRFGIGRDDTTRTTRQVNGAGLLYEAEFIRPCANVGLWVEVEGLDGWPDKGLLRMGGEGHGGYFKKLQHNTAPPLAKVGQELPHNFKLYFATPTYFDGGWQPKDGNWGQYFTDPVTLQAAAIGRYQSIGGYDWANHRHKSAYRYVPAGSVYYFSAVNQPVSLKQNWVCDPTPDGAVIGQIGFGQVIAPAQAWK